MAGSSDDTRGPVLGARYDWMILKMAMEVALSRDVHCIVLRGWYN